MNNDVYLHSFQSILPLHYLPQSELVEWILHAHQKAESLRQPIENIEAFERPFKRFSLNEKYISNRYFECGEVDENWKEHKIYKLTEESPNGATIGERNDYFCQKVQRVFEEIYTDHTPAHLIHVTCTGYASPSPAQHFFSGKNSAPQITHAYHMGCYASLPALRMAQGLSISEQKDIDIVHTEMCSLHLNPTDHTPEQIVVQTLFSDGNIKYSVSEEKQGMKILGILEKLIPDTLDDMTWVPDAFGMRMTLSREVPLKIRDSLPGFIDELCSKCGLKKEKILREGIFAIHPGGPKIVEAVQKKLELLDEQVSLSQSVLFERGNMSSATLPHIWEKVLKEEKNQGKKVLSLAFGPGLTIFGAIFEVC